MRKILIIGEHPANQSGFGRLTGNMATLLHESPGFDEVTVLGIMPRKTTHILTVSYILISSYEYVGHSERRNMYGQESLIKFLQEHDDYTDILCIGDPWYWCDLNVIKSLYPKVTFNYYCPVEGERLPPIVSNAMQPNAPTVNLIDSLSNMDHIIAYSKTGMKAIQWAIGDERCTQYVYHWVDSPGQMTEEPRIKEALKGKFVVGALGRNCFRKSIDAILLAAQEIACRKHHKDIVFLLHVPKRDTFGFSIQALLDQLDPRTKDVIIFTEDIVPGVFIKKSDNGTNVRDIKNGFTEFHLEYLYSKMDVFINMSRSEGFGFPVAEAMLRGIPTLVNGYATPAEVMEDADCTDAAIPIAGREFYASGNNALMGVPDAIRFADMIEKLYEDKEYRENIANKQKTYAEAQLLTSNSPHKDNMVSYLTDYPSKGTSGEKPTVIFITSPMEKCGIRTYTDNLALEIPGSTTFGARNIIDLRDWLYHARGFTFHLQYEQALWPLKEATQLVHKISENNKIVITIHTVNDDFINAVKDVAHHFILHQDLESIPNEQKTIIQHPVPLYDINSEIRRQARFSYGIPEDAIVIGLNGFALPYKHLSEQASAVIKFIKHAMEKKTLSKEIHLLLVCSPHQNDKGDIGRHIIDGITSYSDIFGVGKHVHHIYEFLPREELAFHMSAMDVALMYHNSVAIGAQSGSVRELLAAGVVPIVMKDPQSSMHDELLNNRCVIGLGATDKALGPTNFAKSTCILIDKLLKEDEQYDTIMKSAREAGRKYVAEHSYRTAGQTHMEIYRSL